ncbi:uncharacterized protein N7459_001636 [Penicillium hispanicum]|uniref:uncharacterized protein n=1 Tax=Penicillium hispanicum TaxID=1080232 RepID=UPI0025424340|nr:uncharacterized protein N7459_001636 [Penicillium hispanicum]KAJ5595428.1 hypothetical protein N7459_001636 [Penicillium hispanicum]
MLFARSSLVPLLASLALAALGNAETTTNTTTATTTSEVASGSSSATTTTSTGSATHTIQVGPKTAPHAYVPHNITADVGDVVVFEFYPTNHSVVKADYMAPCVPASEGLFYSGMFNSFNEDDGNLVGPAPTWSIVINDTQPTFFYCTALGSCLNNGMVGVINPNSTETWDAQYKRAFTYPYMLVPGQSPPAEGGDSTSSASAASTSGSSSSSSGNSLSKGAIAGIAVACAAFVIILGALFFVLGRNRVYRQWMSSQDGRTERTTRWALFNGQGGESWSNRRSELESNATVKPATAEVSSIASPDPSTTTFSPYPASSSAYAAASVPSDSGHWGWDIPSNPRANRQPTELEAHTPIARIPENQEYI